MAAAVERNDLDLKKFNFAAQRARAPIYSTCADFLYSFIGPKEFAAIARRFPACDPEKVESGKPDVRLGFPEAIPRKIQGAIEIVLRRLEVFKNRFEINEDLPAFIESASTDEEKGIRFITAAQFGFYGMCHSAIRENPEWLTGEILGQALMEATQANHIDIAEQILTCEKHNEIPAENLIKTFQIASENGSSIVETLLTYERHNEIPTQELTNAFLLAAKKGYKRIIETLLGYNNRHKRMMLFMFIALALEDVSKNGHISILNILLDYIERNHLWMMLSCSLGLSLQKAARNGHASIVETLLTSKMHSMISAEQLKIVFQKAVEYKHLSIVKILLAYERHTEISAKSLGDALFWAAKQGDTPIVEALLTYERHTEISIRDLRDACRVAAGNGHRSVAKKISTYMREKRSIEE